MKKIAVYRQVYTTFWQDPFVLELTPEGKYFYLYLMTNSKTKQCGCYELPMKVMEFETGYNRETLEKLIQIFVENEKIRYDHDTKEMLLLNWHKHNYSKSPRIITCLEREIEKIKNEEFKRYCIDTLLKGIDTPSRGMQAEQQKEKEEEEEEEEEGASLTDEEKTSLNLLKSIKGYPYDYETDLTHLRALVVDFPQADIIAELQKWKAYKLDKPFSAKSNHRLQLRNWIQKSEEFMRERSAKHGARERRPARDLAGSYRQFVD